MSGLNRKWMQEIKEVFEKKDPNNKGLTTSEIGDYLKSKGAGKGQISGAINTALEIKLLERTSYGNYKLIKNELSNVVEILNDILDNTLSEINERISLTSLDSEDFAKIKSTIDSIKELKSK